MFGFLLKSGDAAPKSIFSPGIIELGVCLFTCIFSELLKILAVWQTIVEQGILLNG
jgi:hypothetical protein